MNKYVNIIIISFFACLSCKYDFGFAFFIPIAFFLILNDVKSLYIVSICSIISMYFFGKIYMIELLVIIGSAILYYFVFSKYKSLALSSCFVFVITFFTFILMKDNINLETIIKTAIYSLVSMIIYLYFNYNIIPFKYKGRLFKSYCYVEMIMAIVTVFGASTIVFEEINLSLFIAFYFSMYFSSNSYHALSILYSILTMTILRFLFNINEAILIPFISALFMLESLYSSIITICLCFILWVFKTDFIRQPILEITIFTALFFELFRFSLISSNLVKEEVTKGVYESSLEKVNSEIVGFASFLDLLSKDYTTSRQYAKKVSMGIDELSRRYCDNCYLKKECYQRNKGKMYNHFKDILLYSKRENLDGSSTLEFYKSCPYIVDIKKSASLINDRLKMDEENARNNLVISQINGISNVLRQYIVDNSLKTEINYEAFYKLKQALIDQGFTVSIFNVKSSLKEDFIIEVGLRNINFLKMKERLEEIASFILERKVSIVFITNKKLTTFINIIPKVLINIDYGYGSLGANKSICGDNYLIKELEGARLIAAISDGMGKGIEAMDESSQTLKLIDEISSSNLSSSTSLQIINTFYYIQEYLEKYSTLDYIEIARTLKEAVIYKMGSSTTYIYHEDGSLDKIYNKSLPFGIEEEVEETKIALKENDVIIMASDGVFENVIDEEDFEHHLQEMIHETPQKITYEVLNYVKRANVKVNDDISVITLKIIPS